MGNQPVRVVAAACDGACRGNPGPGGWGALLRFEDGQVQELGGFEPATTNNRMELTAALALFAALRSLPHHPQLVIRTDSRYLIDGLQTWLAGWKRRGWRTASGGPVLNQDLWQQLEAARLPQLQLVHVRGHSGDPDNDRCDAIAVAFAQGRSPRLATAGFTTGPFRADGSAVRSDAKAARRSSDPSPATPSQPGEPAAAALLVDPDAPRSAVPDDPAPAALTSLLGRLELADRLAAGGYGLSLVELAQLVELPLRRLEARQAAWTWRDWRVLPLADGRWRLERGAGGLEERSPG
ncbi:MAG: ribonuclease H [Synechococcaceae cyanobacterium]|jgi:ribonuclease HI|nr:ribonuclease H [Synechococcaceae cyanobacterium]